MAAKRARTLPPPLPSPEEVSKNYFDWTIYADEVMKVAERGRVHYFEEEVPRSERRALALPDAESEAQLEARALNPAQWKEGKGDWEPDVLCANCDNDRGKWFRLAGTSRTICERCFSKMKESAPIAPSLRVRRRQQFPPVRTSSSSSEIVIHESRCDTCRKRCRNFRRHGNRLLCDSCHEKHRLSTEGVIGECSGCMTTRQIYLTGKKKKMLCRDCQK